MINILLVDVGCVSPSALKELGIEVTACSMQDSICSDLCKNTDLAVVSSLSAYRRLKSLLNDIPVVFVASSRRSAKTAFKLGCIDFMLRSEVKDLLTKLATYAKISNVQKTIEKLLDKPL